MVASITNAYMSISVSDLYEGWLSGKSQNQLRDLVTLPNGKKPSKSGIRYWIIKSYGKKAFDRKSNSLRRSLFQDLLRGKLRVPPGQLEATKQWIITSPESDLMHPKYYAEGEMYRDASRNFPFKPEIHLVEPEEEIKIFQLVTKRGAVWSESENFDELLTAEMILMDDGVWVGDVPSVRLHPACKLV